VIRALVLVAVMTGCGGTVGDGPGSASDEDRLAQSMCADLSAGFSMFQMHSQAVDHYRDGRSEDAAQLAASELEDLATGEFCPEFRDDFEATIWYETWIEP